MAFVIERKRQMIFQIMYLMFFQLTISMCLQVAIPLLLCHAHLEREKTIGISWKMFHTETFEKCTYCQWKMVLFCQKLIPFSCFLMVHSCLLQAMSVNGSMWVFWTVCKTTLLNKCFEECVLAMWSFVPTWKSFGDFPCLNSKLL